MSCICCTMDEYDLGGIGKPSRKRLSDVIKHYKGCIKTADVFTELEIIVS